MLTLNQVRVQQGDFVVEADCVLPSGITAILGPSGGGKSTLLSAIAGFLPVAEGDVRFDGTSLTSLAPGQRPVSILFQDNNLFPHLTLMQNVGLALRPGLRLSREERLRVVDALRAVGLEGLETRKPRALSGGQQSRAALARILLAGRPVVLLDEPFAALGPGLKSEMLGLVQSTLDGADRVIVMVTHDPDDAKAIADHVCLLSDQELAAPVDTQELFLKPPPALLAYLGSK